LRPEVARVSRPVETGLLVVTVFTGRETRATPATPSEPSSFPTRWVEGVMLRIENFAPLGADPSVREAGQDRFEVTAVHPASRAKGGQK